MDAEQRLDELEDDSKRFDLDINELKTVVMGPPPNRSNGLNGKLNALVKKVEDIWDWAQNIWTVRRRAECIGLEALEKYKVEQEKIMATKLEELSGIKIAKINLKGVYVMGILQFLGLIGVALIGIFL